MQQTITITIKRLSYSNKADKKELQKLRDSCINEWFAAGYACKNVSPEPQYELHEGRPDSIYVALDEDQRLVGFLQMKYIRNQEKKVDAIWLRLLSARTGRHGIGTKLVQRLICDARRDRRHKIQFIIVPWGGGNAFTFYLKKGFLQYGATPYAVYKIKTIPDISRIRFYNFSISYDQRLHFSKKEDNMERWKKEYASLSEAKEITEFPKLKRQDVIFADKKQLQQITLYPSWAYKYGRRMR